MRFMRGKQVLAAACFALLLACAAAFFLVGCGGAKATDASPGADVAAATVEVSSQLDEASQLVDVSIPFSASLETQGDASGDVQVTLDGGEPDAKTVSIECAATGTVLHVQLSPGPEAKGVDTPYYFACYLGKLRIQAKSADGALPHVSGPDGSAAVLADAVELTIPSGMSIKTVSSEPAETCVEVTQFAQIRCCTWFAVGDELIYMHHHRFAQESVESCAAALAETITSATKGAYLAQAEKSRVIVRAQDAPADERFDVRIVEGVGV